MSTIKRTLTDGKIIDCLIELEKCLQLETYNIYYSNLTSFYGINDVQREATRIMTFLGLHDYLPIVSFVKTESNQGGYIELNCNSDKVVHIHINQEYENNHKKMLTVLAHEICHKLLFVKGLYYPDDKEKNEILTDLATIYTGLAGLTLCGCHEEIVTEEPGFNGSVTKKTITNTIGYLSLEDFISAYYYVCLRFGVDTKIAISGLTSDLTKKVNVFFQEKKNNYTDCEVKDRIIELQSDVAELTRLTTIIEDILKQTKAIVHKRHQTLNKDLLSNLRISDGKYDANMAALKLKLYEDNGTGIKDFDEITKRYSGVLKVLDYTGTKNMYDNAQESLLNIECPICGYSRKSALKEYRNTVLTCPFCKYPFFWKTKQSDGVSRKTCQDSSNDDNTLFSKFKNLFN